MKERVKIVIDEDGNPSIDILGGVGKSCSKEAKEWADLAGGGAHVTKKPEYFVQKTDKVAQKQTNR